MIGKIIVPVDVACSLVVYGVAYDYPYGCSLGPLVSPSCLDVVVAGFVVHSLASYLLAVFSFDPLVIVDLFVVVIGVVVVELVVLEHYPLVMRVMGFEVNSQYIDCYNFRNFRTYYLLVRQHSRNTKKLKVKVCPFIRNGSKRLKTRAHVKEDF